MGTKLLIQRRFAPRAGRRGRAFLATSVTPKAKQKRDKMRQLSAPLRWLESHTGKSWEEVRKALLARFDTHMFGGRQVVYDDKNSWVVSVRDINHRYAHFVVDEEGTLQRGLRFPAKLFKFQLLPEGKRYVSHKRIERWAAGRKVGRRGRHFFWFVPVRNGRAGTLSGYRQDLELDERDTRFWNSLLVEAQAKFVYDKVGI